MSTSDMKSIKKRIVNAIKDLDRTDCIDLCVLIKSNINDSSVVSETPRGTFIDLDKLDDELLKQMDHMISTKLQRIASR